MFGGLAGRSVGHRHTRRGRGGDRQGGGIRTRTAGTGDGGTVRLRTRLLQQRLGGHLARRRRRQRYRRSRRRPGQPLAAGLPLRRLRLGILDRRGSGNVHHGRQLRAGDARRPRGRARSGASRRQRQPAGADRRTLEPDRPQLRRTGHDQHGLRGLGLEGVRCPGLGPLPRGLIPAPEPARRRWLDLLGRVERDGQGRPERTRHDRRRDRGALRSRRTAPTTPRSPRRSPTCRGCWSTRAARSTTPSATTPTPRHGR